MFDDEEMCIRDRSKDEKKLVEKMRETEGFKPGSGDKKSIFSKMKDFFD